MNPKDSNLGIGVNAELSKDKCSESQVESNGDNASDSVVMVVVVVMTLVVVHWQRCGGTEG